MKDSSPSEKEAEATSQLKDPCQRGMGTLFRHLTSGVSRAAPLFVNLIRTCHGYDKGLGLVPSLAEYKYHPKS
jgi:hypothetical protein